MIGHSNKKNSAIFVLNHKNRLSSILKYLRITPLRTLISFLKELKGWDGSSFDGEAFSDAIASKVDA